jgi:putative transposase
MVDTQNYSSDLTFSQWELIKGFLEQKQGRGRPRLAETRKVMDGILYILRTGCQWRYLPSTYPRKSIVYYYFSKWREDQTLDEVMKALRGSIRLHSGRNLEPSAAIIDSQTVKSTEMCRNNVGYDAAKKTKGRKRHIAVDVLGLLICVMVKSDNIQDYKGAFDLLSLAKEICPKIQRFWADSGYHVHSLLDWVTETLKSALEIIKRPRKTFKIVQWRWVVERTFGWLNRYRRLSKDYETLTTSSEAWIKLAMINIMVRRLA